MEHVNSPITREKCEYMVRPGENHQIFIFCKDPCKIIIIIKCIISSAGSLPLIYTVSALIISNIFSSNHLPIKYKLSFKEVWSMDILKSVSLFCRICYVTMNVKHMSTRAFKSFKIVPPNIRTNGKKRQNKVILHKTFYQRIKLV